jgi:hypothetical protein
MKKILFLVVGFLVFTTRITAQDIDINKKTGLVKLNGEEAYYLKSTNKILFVGDFSLQNINGVELAYLKTEQIENTNDNLENIIVGMYLKYTITFTQSGNKCNFYNISAFNTRKALVKLFNKTGLIKNGLIDAEAEEKFITDNGGVYNKNNSSDLAKPKSGLISFNAEKIYENEAVIGNYTTTKNNDTITVTVYNTANELVCNAIHPFKDSVEWQITFYNNIIHKIEYNTSSPLEKLVSYLIEIRQL